MNERGGPKEQEAKIAVQRERLREGRGEANPRDPRHFDVVTDVSS